jgi:hypothetical protein
LSGALGEAHNSFNDFQGDFHMNAILRCTLATLVAVIGLMSANQAKASKAIPLKTGELIVVDKADFFSNDAVKKAKDDFALLQSANERRVVIYTIKELPADAKADFDKRENGKGKRDFWRQFAAEQAKTDKKADVFILICRSAGNGAPGHVQVLADETMRKGGFADKEEQDIAKIFLSKFQEAGGKPAKDAIALHDEALLAAVKELRRNLAIPLPENHNGQIIVDDGGGMVSADGIKKAKAALAEVRDHVPREMTVVSYRELTATQKKEFEKLEKPEAKQEFWSEWAKNELTALKAQGVVVLISRSPGYIGVYADKATRAQGFTGRDEQLVRKILLDNFKDANDKSEPERTAFHDKGLINAAEFVSDAYKKMVR